MKIGICGDVHWSQYSSIIRHRGDEYSARLENLITSINWFENLCLENSCDIAIYLGDFFDKSELNSEEIAALNKINWNSISKYFIVGNHEMGKNDLSYSSAHLFNLCSNIEVINKPCLDDWKDFEIGFLPYILESQRKNISEYFPSRTSKPRYIFSHNDIKGIQYGGFLSQNGFDISDIEKNCDLYLNGHLHNGSKISKKIYNVGNITGQNFSEDAFQYKHNAFILNTDSGKLTSFENPQSFKFYKIDTESVDINKTLLYNNAVVAIKCKEAEYESIKSWISSNNNIIDSKITIQPEIIGSIENNIETLTVDHLEKFREFILGTFGNSEAISQELFEVLK